MSEIPARSPLQPLTNAELADLLTRVDAIPAELSSAIGAFLPPEHKRAVSRLSIRTNGHLHRVLHAQIRADMVAGRAGSFAQTRIAPGGIDEFFCDKTKILTDIAKLGSRLARAAALIAFGASGSKIDGLYSRRISPEQGVSIERQLAQLNAGFIDLTRDLTVAQRSRVIVAALAGYTPRWMVPVAREGLNVLGDMRADAPERSALLDAVIDRIDLKDDEVFDAVLQEIERSPPQVMMRAASVLETNRAMLPAGSPELALKRFNRVMDLADRAPAPNRWEMAFLASRLSDLPPHARDRAARTIASWAAECPAAVPAGAARPSLEPFTRDEFFGFVISQIEQNASPAAGAAIAAPLRDLHAG